MTSQASLKLPYTRQALIATLAASRKLDKIEKILKLQNVLYYCFMEAWEGRYLPIEALPLVLFRNSSETPKKKADLPRIQSFLSSFI